jgi:hypothetical protein
VIPDFNDSGCLPPGVHRATLAEIELRFGGPSEMRRVQMESIRWMIGLALRARVRRIVLNGSFVTDIMEPNDVDCVLLIEPGSHGDQEAEDELLQGLPFLDISMVGQPDFDYFINRFFALDRKQESKGMIEVTR